MPKADSKITTEKPIVAQMTEGLFEMEDSLLRIRDLTQVTLMEANSPELSKEETGALQALAYTILDEINEVIEERTRLCHLPQKSEGGSHAQG
jgi:hypothetical protein